MPRTPVVARAERRVFPSLNPVIKDRTEVAKALLRMRWREVYFGRPGARQVVRVADIGDVEIVKTKQTARVSGGVKSRMTIFVNGAKVDKTSFEKRYAVALPTRKDKPRRSSTSVGHAR